MNEMYRSFYQIQYNPFEKEAPNGTFESKDYNEAKTRFDYLIKVKGLGLFTGSPGNGKTYSFKNYINKYNPNLYKFIYIHASTVTVNEFYKALCYGLGIEPLFRKIDMFKSIQEAFVRMNKERKIMPVVIIDEAQFLKPAIFHDLSLLMNFEMDSKNYVTIVLLGLSYLSSILNKNIYEPLKQRIIVNYDFIGLEKEEIANYKTQSLTKAGNPINLFAPAAIESIANYSNGSIRKLNNILTKCLIVGSSTQTQTITPDIVLIAQNDIEIK